MSQFRNRSPYRARSMRQGGQPWTPVSLAPYAWYDVHAGGTSTTIVDKSGNGRADATYGATTAAPLYLPYTGIPYVHLEAAGAGTNSISCTAPANTASYSAAPLGGGAPTTGVAAEGAFAFTTSGDWVTIELLDAGAVVLARFIAADCTQTGVTDSFAVAWTINRGTAGRKTVVFGPVASSTRSLALFGTNDTIAPPNAAFPSTTAQSIVVVSRQHATLSANARLISNRTASTTVGISLFAQSATSHHGGVQDGSGTFFNFGSVTTTVPGTRYVVAGVGLANNTRQLYFNNAVTAAATTPATWQTGTSYLIGANPGPANYADMEFTALLTIDRALTAGEIALLVTFYSGGS